ncbi:MAG: DUF971 domain-containing protein [Algisphaera sp.]
MHQPLQFGRPNDDTSASIPVPPLDPAIKPVNLELKRDTALTLTWSDGRVSVYPIAYLRRRSPSADSKQLEEELATNPLAILPSSGSSAPLTAETAKLVGHYALNIVFSDGHDTGIYSWAYLRDIDPATT